MHSLSVVLPHGSMEKEIYSILPENPIASILLGNSEAGASAGSDRQETSNWPQGITIASH